MGVPIRIVVDGFQFQREPISPGCVFNCPTDVLAAYLIREGHGTLPSEHERMYMEPIKGSFLMDDKRETEPEVDMAFNPKPKPRGRAGPGPGNKLKRGKATYKTRVMTPEQQETSTSDATDTPGT